LKNQEGPILQITQEKQQSRICSLKRVCFAYQMPLIPNSKMKQDFDENKDVSSWKGPELERVSKVRLLFRGSELTLESGRGLQMPFSL
jgi:hypothetical protein